MRRRTFFHLGAGATLLAGIPSCSKTSGPEVRVGVIGLQGRGKQLISDGILKAKGVRLTAICDVDQRELEERSTLLAKDKITVTKFTDYRKLLESKEIDAVFIATPNHTHTLIAMTALAAGKHVYVEKPVCHNLWEGKMLLEAAAKKPNLIIQHGMQRRSNTGWADAMKYLADGKLGKVTLARGINYKPRESIGLVTSGTKVNKNIDQNLWFGPRTPKPVMRTKFHYEWHWFWEYGNGDIGNQGPHQLDVALWSLGDPKLPSEILSLGNRWGYEDNGETPNQQLAFFKNEAGSILFDNRGLPAKSGSKAKYEFQGKFEVGNAIHCEKGWIGERFVYDNDGKVMDSFKYNEDIQVHVQSFISSVQAGKQLSDNLHIKKGVHAASHAILANISYRLGKAAGTDVVKEQIKGNAAALATYEDLLANLAANQVDVAVKQTLLGAALNFDAASYQFTGAFAAEANALLTEDYRDEFKLPIIS